MSMFQKTVILLVCISISAILGSQLPSSYGTPYINEKIHFSIQYPDGWTKYESYNQTSNMESILFSAPANSAFIAIGYLPTGTYSQPRSADEIFNSIESAIYSCVHFPDLEDSSCARVIVYDHRIIALDGKMAYQYKYGLVESTEQYNSQFIEIPVDTSLYLIHTGYDAHIFSFEDIISPSLNTIHIGDIQSPSIQQPGVLDAQKTSPTNTDSFHTAVTTDKSEYHVGDTVQISGHVNQLNSGMPVTLIVRNPLGTPALITQLKVANDMSYSTQMTIPNQGLWDVDGSYKVSVQYGATESAETSFTLIRNSQASAPVNPNDQSATPEQKSIEFPNISFPSYTLFVIAGGVIVGIIILFIFTKKKRPQRKVAESIYKHIQE